MAERRILRPPQLVEPSPIEQIRINIRYSVSPAERDDADYPRRRKSQILAMRLFIGHLSHAERLRAGTPGSPSSLRWLLVAPHL
jgi:hypothetical protein